MSVFCAFHVGSEESRMGTNPSLDIFLAITVKVAGGAMLVICKHLMDIRRMLGLMGGTFVPKDYSQEQCKGSMSQEIEANVAKRVRG
jgi:hypothetical protein